MTTEMVEMTPQERAEYEAFKAEQAKRREAEQRKAARDTYATMVDSEVAAAIPLLRETSENLKSVKDRIYGDFDAILKMKSEITGVATDEQSSHTFTTSDGKYRLILGVNCIDGYRDTVEDGIAMVKGYLESLARDTATEALVAAVLKLLSRDGQGNIKASRVLQLRKMAEGSGDERFIEGVRIIEESYQPTVSKRYIRAQYKDEQGAWKYIPLGMTDVD
ncbi:MULTISPECIES: DUF3164 family protein [Muribaculaceae]|uniref:DUF3164 family protein n=1 Tax=Muribaculaceae TaxID=2005473 RepID=UPI0025B31332|nr:MULTISPECIES: DUF3164 family protein [Muribaculaceae]